MLLCFGIIIACIFCTALVFRWKRIRLRHRLSAQYGLHSNSKLVAFFHPYCTSGGGGERVLWTAIYAMQTKFTGGLVFVYTGDTGCLYEKKHIFDSIRLTFGISLEEYGDYIHFIPLRSVSLLSPSMYPIFTLAGQAIGSLIVGMEALLRFPPDLFIDTTGFAFTLPLAKWLLGCVTVAYVHYPTISSDMVDRVRSSTKSNTNSGVQLTYNNAAWIQRNWLLSSAKLMYYRLMVMAYKWAGNPCNVDLVFTNSTWTWGHICSLWGGRPIVLYPPCPVPTSIVEKGTRMPWIMSVGQFRPEKNHELQLYAFKLFLDRLSLLGDSKMHEFRLLLFGGSRGVSDECRVLHLQELTKSLGISDVVQFHVNAPYSELQRYFHECTINLHTMVDEHFGISIVEGMSNGLITVAHKSGGPLTDIIGPAALNVKCRASDPAVGLLAATPESYADAFEHILLRMSSDEIRATQEAAFKRASEVFSEDCFSRGWLRNFMRLGL